MSIFKDMLYLHGYLIEPRFNAEPEAESYADGYGNRVASNRSFAPLGRTGASAAHSRGPAANPSSDTLCPSGSCA